MNCAVCNKEIVYIGDPNPLFLTVTKYWAVKVDGSRRPYCSCACGLSEYTHNLAEKDTPPQQP